MCTLLCLPAIGSAAVTADFNNDGIDDFVVGDRLANIPGVSSGGQVSIIQRDRNGEMRADNWHRVRVPGTQAPGSYAGGGFGESVAVGDFDGDGYQDLAVGASRESLQRVDDSVWSGAVTVIYGMAGGLDQSRHQVLRSRYLGLWNQLGYAMASGDFNGDGKDDLAVGAPGRALPGERNELLADGPGGVSIFFGATEGFTDRTDWSFDRSQSLVAGTAQPGARFGESLAVGDFDGDGYDDLLMGAPRDDVTRAGRTHVDAGSVTLKFGSSTGFRAEKGILIHDVDEARNDYDLFGSSLISGNFNNDRYDDFAIGHVGESVGSKRSAGAVTVHYGNRRSLVRGIIGNGSLWYQNRSGVPGTSESGDQFGNALATGDFDRDGNDDLAIGIVGEDIERRFAFDRNNAGAVLVLYGARTGGLTVRGSASDFHQDKPGVAGGAESNDLFGSELSTGDYNGDGVTDLVVGVTGESVSGVNTRGIIQVIDGHAFAGLRPHRTDEKIYHKGNVRSLGGRRFGLAMPR